MSPNRVRLATRAHLPLFQKEEDVSVPVPAFLQAWASAEFRGVGTVRDGVITPPVSFAVLHKAVLTHFPRLGSIYFCVLDGTWCECACLCVCALLRLCIFMCMFSQVCLYSV